MALNMWFTSMAFQYSAHPYVPATLNYYYQQCWKAQGSLAVAEPSRTDLAEGELANMQPTALKWAPKAEPLMPSVPQPPNSPLRRVCLLP